MKKIILFLSVIVFSNTLLSQTLSKRKANFNLESNIAIQGYDPVGYFNHKAIKGKQDIVASYQGVNYLFFSVENKDTFLKNPSAYEPQYGGWCAYAMGAKGEKVEIDPETFKIIDGKLYLFYNAYFINTLKSWNKDEAGLKKKADINWKKIIN